MNLASNIFGKGEGLTPTVSERNERNCFSVSNKPVVRAN